ncbi:MAG TPA: WecB/TagA/CpsF family glycosyltransferase [Patescibacteria group bacterium]
MYRSIILGVEIDKITRGDARQRFKDFIYSKNQHYIVTPNPEIIIAAQKDDDYKKILNQSSLSLPDGAGLYLAGLIFKDQIRERITGTDFVEDICQLAQKNNWSLYLAGGAGQTARRAADNLRQQYPKLKIAAAEEGMTPENFSFDSQDIINKINRAGPQILLVAFGAPKQEKWIYYNLNKLKTVQVAMGVGGAFDYISGNVKRAPAWMRKMGLEWLFRLLTQPWRLNRIWTATIVFCGRIIYWRLRMIFKYRQNVAALVFNKHNQILVISPRWKKYLSWALPQGGIKKKEGAGQAARRELSEELGTDQKNFKVIKIFTNFYEYNWPKWARQLKGYKGQKQALAIVKFSGSDKDLNIARSAEVKAIKWVTPENLLKVIEDKRRDMVQKALTKMYGSHQDNHHQQE